MVKPKKYMSEKEIRKYLAENHSAVMLSAERLALNLSAPLDLTRSLISELRPIYYPRKKEKKSLKRLFFDIETSPNIGFFWQPGHKLTIGYENIIKERAIICICYKWSGENKVHELHWSDSQSDKEMLQKFIEIANTADELIGHNGDNFDLKWIRTRCIFHGISMLPTYVTIDTLKESRRGFRFNSNRLDYISDFLIGKGKTETGFNLWKKIVLENHKPSLLKMIKYCKNDVLILEKVFNKLDKYIKPKSSVTANRKECPSCGSKHMMIATRRRVATGLIRVQLRCVDCGKHNTISEKEFNKTK